jgi:hypothetical protein
MAYRLRWEGHGVYRRFFGPITAAEFYEAYLEMTGDPRFEGCRYLLSDYLNAHPGADLGARDLRAIAALERLRHHDSPDTMQARVATDPRTLEYIRYYDSLGIGPYRLGTFATVEDARRWIAGGPRRTFVPRPGTNALEPTQVPLIANLDQ